MNVFCTVLNLYKDNDFKVIAKRQIVEIFNIWKFLKKFQKV